MYRAVHFIYTPVYVNKLQVGLKRSSKLALSKVPLDNNPVSDVAVIICITL